MLAQKWHRYKPLLDQALVPLIVVLVGVGAFGLGRLSALQEAQVPLTIHGPVVDGVEQEVLPAPAPGTVPTVSEGEGAYVASKGGTKYYLPSCSGVGRIKEENRVYFASVADAQAAGYAPASNCPGL